MKWHTIKSEKMNARKYGSGGRGGEYASFPIYEHATVALVGYLEAWTADISRLLKLADAKNDLNYAGHIYQA